MVTKVKICGITRLEDGLAAAEAGADFLGYIFYVPSKRFVAPRSAAEIVREVRRLHPAVQHVGVFVDETADNVAWTRGLANLDFAQLHGKESADYCRELHHLDIPTIKALGIGPHGPLVNHVEFDTVDYFLCDTHDEALKGGTGRSFNLDLLPKDLSATRMFVAGGLTAATVGELVSTVAPYAVDVSSGVELQPGIKCHDKVSAFIRAVRAAHPGEARIG